jgi:hypothetical protein
MMDMEKLCERLLAKMETHKEDLMAKLDAKRKTTKKISWQVRTPKDEPGEKKWLQKEEPGEKKSAQCGLRQRIPEQRRWSAKRWRHTQKKKTRPQWI